MIARTLRPADYSAAGSFGGLAMQQQPAPPPPPKFDDLQAFLAELRAKEVPLPRYTLLQRLRGASPPALGLLAIVGFCVWFTPWWFLPAWVILALMIAAFFWLVGGSRRREGGN